MKTLDYNLPDDLKGGKITGFNYSRSLNELIGSWSAEVAGGSFKAGETISFGDVMTGGIIENAYKDNTGLWHLEGKDAGYKLMKSTPDELPTGNAGIVIKSLAEHCGITCNFSGGLEGFDVRSLVSGSTCAEAILELAMLSGCVAYIDNRGNLALVTPSETEPSFGNVINDTGTSIDLDGYATKVLVNLTCRTQESDGGTETEYTSGKTPSASPDKVTYSGSLSNGDFSVTMWDEPYNVIEKVDTTVENPDSGITIHTVETHNYEYKDKTVTRQNNDKEKQEFRLIAFYESGYKITKTTEGTYNGQKFKEVMTEELTRSTGSSNVPNPPQDWIRDNTPKMIDEENLTRSTVRSGPPDPESGMPPYSPPFDCKIKKKFSRSSHGFKTLVICEETETRYEERQIGTVSPVKVDGELIPHFMLDSNLAIQTHSTPEWVPIKTYRTYCDLYDANNECKASTHSEYCDDGAEWLSKNAVSDTGDEELNKYQKAYAAFSQNSQGLEITLGSSQVDTFWQFVELPGEKTTKKKKGEVDLGDVSSWYDNGEYLKSLYVCPHVTGDKPYQCNVCTLDGSSTTNCTETNSYGLFPMKFNFRDCGRAKKALEEARKQDESEITPSYIGTASKSGANVGYQRDIYIDKYFDEEEANEIAKTIAENILKVKSNKGIRRTVTVPYDASYLPDGCVVEVSHDWANMQTSVTYREDGDIPEFMITQSMSGVASFVAARENARSNIPKYGVVTKCKDGTEEDTDADKEKLKVKVGDREIPCSTRLKNIAKGDVVLVTFAAGNKMRGQVIARL